MSDDIIPPQARDFLLQNFDSIAEWEGLLLLRQTPKQRWDAYTASRSLYISEDSTAAVLAALAARGLLEVSQTPAGKVYRYRPATRDLAEGVDTVAALYNQYLIAVTQIIHNKAKLRMQQFADSFKFRKD